MSKSNKENQSIVKGALEILKKNSWSPPSFPSVTVSKSEVSCSCEGKHSNPECPARRMIR